MSTAKHASSSSIPYRRKPASASRKAELHHAAAGGDAPAKGAAGRDKATIVCAPAPGNRRLMAPNRLAPSAAHPSERGSHRSAPGGGQRQERSKTVPVKNVRLRTPLRSRGADTPSADAAPTSPPQSALVGTMSLEQAIADVVLPAMGPRQAHQEPGCGTLHPRTHSVAPEPFGHAARPGATHPIVSFRPGPETVKAIITAAAIIACVDGQVSDAERRTLLDFLRRKGILEREGRAAATAAFDQAVALAVTLDLDHACAAVDSLRAVAERPGAPLVAHAATLVALADGVGWPQEIAMLEVIRDRLGLRAGSRADAEDVLQ